MDSKHKFRALLLMFSMVLLLAGVVAAANWKTLVKKIPALGTLAGAAPEKAGDGTEAAKEETTSANADEGKEQTVFSYFESGYAGANPDKQVGDSPRAFLEDASFFDTEKSEYETWMEERRKPSLEFMIASVERDMRIQVQDDMGNFVTGLPFVIHIEGAGDYVDQDRDGLIYVSDLAAGEYEVSLQPVDGYETPAQALVRVRDKVAYTAIPDISLLIKTEEEIVAEQEDTGEKDALKDTDGTEVKDVRDLGGKGIMGIDVSKWNGNIDWDKVRNAGIEFAIIRAGYRGAKSGVLVEDPYFDQNMRGAQGAGLRVGVYFFTQAVTEVEAVEEASMVLSLCKPYHVSYPIFIDTEAASGEGRANNLDMLTRSAVCKAFCETIEDGGYTSGVYGSRNWFRNKLYMEDMEKYCIWLAEYRQEPSYAGAYQFWQYTSGGKVDGIDGRVDLDVGYLVY